MDFPPAGVRTVSSDAITIAEFCAALRSATAAAMTRPVVVIFDCAIADSTDFACPAIWSWKPPVETASHFCSPALTSW